MAYLESRLRKHKHCWHEIIMPIQFLKESYLKNHGCYCETELKKICCWCGEEKPIWGKKK